MQEKREETSSYKVCLAHKGERIEGMRYKGKKETNLWDRGTAFFSHFVSTIA